MPGQPPEISFFFFHFIKHIFPGIKRTIKCIIEKNNFIPLYSMKRMGIFIFYDEAGIVDEYIEVLLSSMQDILERLVVIVNGNVRDEGYILCPCIR